MKCQISKFLLHYINIRNEGTSVNSGPPLGYDDDDGSTGPSLDILDEVDPTEPELGSGSGNPQKSSSREECMERLKSGGRF